MWWALAGVIAAAPVKLAVLPFDNDTADANYEPLRRGLAELVISDLTVVEGVQLVERLRLEDARTELKLQQTKDFDPKSRLQFGKLLGATHVVLGALIAASPKVMLNLRVVDVKSGATITQAKLGGAPEDLFELEDQVVKQLVEALRLKFPGIRSGHVSLPAMVSWAQAAQLADANQLAEAQSKAAEAVRLAPDFTLAKEQYAAILKRVREAQKKRGGVIDERVKTLTEHLTAQLGKPPLERSLGARIGLCNLALLELQRLLDAKKGEASWVEPGKRAEVERLERLFVTHAAALVGELRAARGKNVSPRLDDADAELAEKTFDLDLAAWDFATPTSVAADLGNFLGSGWSPYRSDVPQFAIRPCAAQRSFSPAAPPAQTGFDEASRWFDTAAKELPKESPDAREGLASKLYNERAEMLVLLGRREEGVAQWQAFLDQYPTAEDFAAFSQKLEAVMLLDDEAERDEKRIKSCDAALLDSLPTLMTRTWRAKGASGLFSLGESLRACAKKNAAFERAGWNGPANELQRVADCESYDAWRARAAKAGVTLDPCR